MEILDAAVAAGARAREVATVLGVGLTTLQRWRRQVADDKDGLDRRKGSHRMVSHHLSDEKRQRILLTCNQPEFAALPPGQIVSHPVVRSPHSILADGGLLIGSERSFYRVLLSHGQVHPVAGPGRPRSPAPCRGWRPEPQIMCGVRTSPTCPPEVGGSICGLVHRSELPQWHPARDPISAPQRQSR